MPNEGKENETYLDKPHFGTCKSGHTYVMEIAYYLRTTGDDVRGGCANIVHGLKKVIFS